MSESPLPAAATPAPCAPEKCVVLVPVGGAIEPACDDGLKALEARGYRVWRVRGFAAIDAARNTMASDAIAQGFEETLWIDADIVFHPDDVERLRSHALPIVCGIYPKKGRRELACHVIPGTPTITFGEKGGLVELLYVGAGFLLVRRQVYFDIRQRLELPVCDERFGTPTVPYFQPLVRADGAGHWYLGEDYAFCERARRCGYTIWADSSIRLGHVGSYAFTWEDAGSSSPRYKTYHFQLSHSSPYDSASKEAAGAAQPPADVFPARNGTVGRLAAAFPWPSAKPTIAPNEHHGWLFPSTRELLSSVLSPETRLVVELGSWLGLSTRFIADRAPTATVVAIDHWQGSPEHHDSAELRKMLPTLYETFLASCWAYKERIVPLRMDTLSGLAEVAHHGLKPDVIFLDADHRYESVKADVLKARSLFPDATLVGDDWDWESVRQALTDVAASCGAAIETHGVAWRFVPAT